MIGPGKGGSFLDMAIFGIYELDFLGDKHLNFVLVNDFDLLFRI